MKTKRKSALGKNLRKPKKKRRPRAKVQSVGESFKSLIQIVAQLRGPDGCPWDREQTQKTLVQYAIEEAFELAEAIENGSTPDIQEELGDFLFQVILQAQVAQDEGSFSLVDVIQNLNKKMISRHPHVFSQLKVKNVEEVWANWESIKRGEKAKQRKQPQYFNVPMGLPALLVANKIGIKTERYKFDWEKPEQVLAKVHEELQELSEAMQQQDKAAIEHELGDLLFSVAQLGRHLKQDPEQCLRIANRRFVERFGKVVELSDVDIDHFTKLSVVEKEKLWARAKLITAKNLK